MNCADPTEHGPHGRCDGNVGLTVARLKQQHEADSVLLNSLVWAIFEQLNLVEPAPGSTKYIATTVNRLTLVSDVIDMIKVGMQAEYDRGYREGCDDCF